MKIPFSLASCRCATWEFIFCSPAQIWTCEMDHIPGWCDHAICAMAVGQSMQSKNLYSIKCVAFHTFPCEHLQVWSNGHLPAPRLPITRTQDAVVGLGEFEIWLGMKTSFIRIFIPQKIRIAGTLWPWLTGCDSIPTWYWKQRRGLEPRKSWPYPFSIIFSLLTFPSSTLFPKAFTNSWDQFFLGFQVNLIFYL